MWVIISGWWKIREPVQKWYRDKHGLHNRERFKLLFLVILQTLQCQIFICLCWSSSLLLALSNVCLDYWVNKIDILTHNFWLQMLQSTFMFHKSMLEAQSFFSLTVKKCFIITVSMFQVFVPRNLSLDSSQSFF